MEINKSENLINSQIAGIVGGSVTYWNVMVLTKNGEGELVVSTNKATISTYIWAFLKNIYFPPRNPPTHNLGFESGHSLDEII